MSEQRCPDCQRLVPRDCALCDCGHQFRKIAEPPSDSKVLFGICTFVICAYLSGYALSGASSWTRLTRDGVGPAFVLLLAFGVFLLSSSTKALRSYLSCGVRIAGCLLFLFGWSSYSSTHNARKELLPKQTVVEVPTYVKSKDLTMFGLSPGLSKIQVDKLLSENPQPEAKLVYDESDILVSIEGGSVDQEPRKLLQLGHKASQVSHAFGEYAKSDGALVTFQGQNRFWGVVTKVSNKEIAVLKLVNKAWYRGDKRHYTIHGLAPSMTRERALTAWGLADRGALSQMFGKGGQTKRQLLAARAVVEGVYGWQLEINGIPVLKVGDSKAQLEKLFPAGLQDGLYQNHHYPLRFGFDKDGKVSGIASGTLADTVLDPVLPASLIEKYKLILSRRVGSKHLNYMLMDKDYYRRPTGISPLPKPVGDGTSEGWTVPKEVPKELRKRATSLSVQRLTVTDLGLSKAGALMIEGKKHGPHTKAVSRVQDQWEFETSEKPVGEKSLWAYDSRNVSGEGLHFLVGDKLYRVTSNDRDFAYSIAREIAEIEGK